MQNRHRGLCIFPPLQNKRCRTQKKHFDNNTQQVQKRKHDVQEEHNKHIQHGTILYNDQMYNALRSVSLLRPGQKVISKVILHDKTLTCKGTFLNKHGKNVTKENAYKWANILYDDGDNWVIDITETPTFYLSSDRKPLHMEYQATIPTIKIDVSGLSSDKRKALHIQDRNDELIYSAIKENDQFESTTTNHKL